MTGALNACNSAVQWQFGFFIFPVSGRFSAKLGPKTPLERRGSSCSAGCTKHQPRRQILRPFRGLAAGTAFSDSRILPFGLGPKPFETRPRRAGFQPSGPVETFVFLQRGRRLQPRVGGPGGGPVLAPSGCPGESSKFSNSDFPLPLQWTAEWKEWTRQDKTRQDKKGADLQGKDKKGS